MPSGSTQGVGKAWVPRTLKKLTLRASHPMAPQPAPGAVLGSRIHLASAEALLPAPTLRTVKFKPSSSSEASFMWFLSNLKTPPFPLSLSL